MEVAILAGGQGMCRHFREDYELETRVARYHNAYCPNGTYEGGREKAPAGDLPKGDRGQADGSARDRDLGRRRAAQSFMYINDCLEGGSSRSCNRAYTSR